MLARAQSNKAKSSKSQY